MIRDRYEEKKGLNDTFMVRLYRLSVVGLPIKREKAIQRVITAARSIDQEPTSKAVYVAYCNNEAKVATRIAQQLTEMHPFHCDRGSVLKLAKRLRAEIESKQTHTLVSNFSS